MKTQQTKSHPCSDESNAPQWPNLEQQQRASGVTESPRRLTAQPQDAASHSPLPWVMDDGMISIKDQAGILLDDIGTDREWTAIGINDQDGIAEIVALAHPINASFIVRACNNAQRLADALRKANTCASLPDSVRHIIREALAQWSKAQ